MSLWTMSWGWKRYWHSSWRPCTKTVKQTGNRWISYRLKSTQYASSNTLSHEIQCHKKCIHAYHDMEMLVEGGQLPLREPYDHFKWRETVIAFASLLMICCVIFLMANCTTTPTSDSGEKDQTLLSFLHLVKNSDKRFCTVCNFYWFQTSGGSSQNLVVFEFCFAFTFLLLADTFM